MHLQKREKEKKKTTTTTYERRRENVNGNVHRYGIIADTSGKQGKRQEFSKVCIHCSVFLFLFCVFRFLERDTVFCRGYGVNRKNCEDRKGNVNRCSITKVMTRVSAMRFGSALN